MRIDDAFLTGTVAGVAATLCAADVFAASTGMWAAAAKGSVVLHDPRILLTQEIRQDLEARGTRTLVIEGDPVRLWRSEAGVPLRDPSTTLLGVTDWADLLIFRGLAAETRRHLRQDRLDTASGAFLWLIA